MRLLIDEQSRDDVLVRTELEPHEGAVAMYVHNTHIGTMPNEAVIQVMRRYGKPIDETVPIPHEGLPLETNARLVMLRFLARYDVIARDWLVLVTDTEVLGELAVTVTPALEHLARAYSGVPKAPPPNR
jgi:hypothetical protein